MTITVAEQIRVIKAATEEACKSKEAAKAFLKAAGITDLMEEASIQQGLQEAAAIHAGKREGKTLDDFLNEQL